MSDMKRLLEAVDKLQFAGEKEGQKPGEQWRGTDPNPPGKKLVGGGAAEESVVKELEQHMKENAVERKLKAQLAEFKQQVVEGKFDPINDDDYYEYNVNTKEIVNRISGKHPEARRFNPLKREWPGRDDDHKIVRGMTAKYLKEATWINGVKQDDKELVWKQTSMSYEEACKKYGKENCKVQGKTNRGEDAVLVKVPRVAEDNLQEVAPLIFGAAARFIVPKVLQLLPKISNMAKQAPKVVGNVTKQAAPVVGQVTKQGAEIVGKNAGAIGTGAGVYTALTTIADGLVGGVGEVYDDVKDATAALTDKIGDALDGASIAELAASAVKYSIPIGIVLAMLYGGKKIIDKVISEEQGVAEATEYGIPDSTPGQLPGGAKMTFGEFKKMWPGVILKRPSGGSLAGSVVADVEGWMNNPKSVWEPLQGVAEESPQTLDELTGWKQSSPQQKTSAQPKKPTAGELLKKSDDKRSELQRNYDAGKKNWFKEGMFGIDSKTKGAIQNVVAKLSDIPNMWDHSAQTFTNLGKEELEKVLNFNPKYIDYAVNLTADDFEADLEENEKIGDKYDPEEFDAMVSRLGQKAKQGPMKTVWDPVKRVYKNVPVNQTKQAVKEYGNATDPDNQATTPGAQGSAEQDKQDDLGAKLGAQATNQSINALKSIAPNLNPQIAKQALAKGDAPNTMSGTETGQAKELSDLLGNALSDPQTSSQVTALLRKAAQSKG